MLIRRRKVAAALEWLKLNHVDYADLDISYDNLSKYPEDQPPVIVNFTKTMAESNIDPEAAAVTGVDAAGAAGGAIGGVIGAGAGAGVGVGAGVLLALLMLLVLWRRREPPVATPARASTRPPRSGYR